MGPHIQKLAVPGVDVDPVVFPVGHEDAVIGGHPDAVGEAELAGPAARFAPGLDERPVGLEAMDSGVAVPVAHIQLAIGRHGHVGRPVEGRSAPLDAAVGLPVVAGVRGLPGVPISMSCLPSGVNFRTV